MWYDKSNANNPNWRGGISQIRSADEILSLNESVIVEIHRRFLRQVQRGCGTECWIWTGGVFKSNGRAKLVLGTNFLASKISYILYKGPIGNACVLHTCDNVLCVNPDHLFLGTKQDNSDDMVAKGRQATGDRNGSRLYPERLVRGDDHYARIHPETKQGENNGRALLTEEQVREIRRRYQPYINNHKPSNQRELAAEYGVAKHVIAAIVRGETWRNVQ